MLKRRLAILVCLVYVLTSIAPFGLFTGISVEALEDPFLEENGMVVMEAENYDSKVARSNRDWQLDTTYSGYSDTGCMMAAPEGTMVRDTGTLSNSPEISYNIYFNTTGTYYIWVLGYAADLSSDSVHAALDGVEEATADRISFGTGSYMWQNSTLDGAPATLDITTAGVHSISLWMREDGFRADKIILTNDAQYIPVDLGPSESLRGMPAPTPTPTPEWYSKSNFSAVYDLGTGNTGIKNVEFDVTPLADGIDGTILYAKSGITVDNFNKAAMAIRMYTNGYFDVRNGAGYSSLASVPYTSGNTYHIRMVTDLDNDNYDVYVTPEGGSEIMLADDYAFRSDAPATDDLGQVVLKSGSNDQFKVYNHIVGNVTTPAPTPAPTPTPTPEWYSKSNFSAVYDLGTGNTGIKNVEFDVIPLADGIDGVVCYAKSGITVDNFNKAAMAIRMYTNGYFDVRNGAGYSSLASVPYTSGNTYHIRMITDLDNDKYDVYVTPEGGSEIMIADDYAFRSDAPATDDLGQVVLKSGSNDQFKVQNHTVGGQTTPTPTATPTPTPTATPTPTPGSGLPVVNVLATDGNASETGLDTATFEFTRTGSTSASLRVYFTVSGTAVSGSDYSALPSYVDIPAGASQKSLILTPINDSIQEKYENVVLHLSDDSEYKAGVNKQAKVLIESDDVALDSEDKREAENAEAFTSITVPSGTSYTTESFAPASDGKYILFNNTETGNTMIYVVTVPVTAIYSVEVGYIKGPDRAKVQFYIDSGSKGIKDIYATDLGTDATSATHTLVTGQKYNFKFKANDKNSSSSSYNIGIDYIKLTPIAEVTTVSVEAVDNQASESGDQGLFTFTRKGNTSGDLAVTYSITGGAGKADSSDYNSPDFTGSITIPAGSSSATLAVTPVNDNIAEADERLIITVKNGSGYLADFKSLAWVTIADNDGPTGAWTKDIVMKEYMEIYDFPEELVSYDITFPGTFPKNQLKLFEMDGSSSIGTEKEYQLTKVIESGGKILSGTLSFRTGLLKGEYKKFRLVYDPGYDVTPADYMNVVNLGDNTAALVGNSQQLRVPHGMINFATPVPISQVAAPIISIAIDYTNPSLGWAGEGSFEYIGAGEELKVTGIEGKVEKIEPMRLEYSITYTIEGGREYKAVLTLLHNEKYAAVDEYLTGIMSTDGIHFKLNMAGIDPNGRLIMSNKGYGMDDRGADVGAYEQGAKPEDGRLPFQIGMFSPNSLTVHRSAMFWNDDGNYGIGFVINRVRDWKTENWQVWNTQDLEDEDLYFYYYNNEKYMRARLQGEERHWALMLIPRDEVIVKGRSYKDIRDDLNLSGRQWLAVSTMEGYPTEDHEQYGVDPAVNLWKKLSELSLDRVKDMVVEGVEENVNARLDILGSWGEEKYTNPQPFSEFDNSETASVNATRYWEFYAEKFWDWSGDLGGAGYFCRGMSAFYPEYANSRYKWSEEQRIKARALLIHRANIAAYEQNSQPHTSMISGHPNFIMDDKQAIAYALALFPDHPNAAALWKPELDDFLNKYFTQYVRNGDPENMAMPGRHTENTACYSLASMETFVNIADAIGRYDASDVAGRQDVYDWLTWYLYNMWPIQKDGQNVRTIPPEGAHASIISSGNGFYEAIRELGERVGYTNETLGESIKWTVTNGTAGIKPDMESALFRDYGVVMRYDVGGPNEAYFHLLQLFNGGYRWAGKGNGVLYYSIKDSAGNFKRLSSNDGDSNGDKFSFPGVTIFKHGDDGLGQHQTDGVLYNFDFAQFYRAAGSNGNYLSRGVMMMRNDYVAIYDDLASTTDKGTFYWSNNASSEDKSIISLPLPNIYTVKGAPAGVQGSGDQLHIVADTSRTVTSESYGAKVGSEYVFLSDTIQTVNDTAKFNGMVGYARANEIAVMEGTYVELDGLRLDIVSGTIGASAKLDSQNNKVVGRIKGQSTNGSGTIKITVPSGFDMTNLAVKVNGQIVTAAINTGSRTIEFSVTDATKSTDYLTYSIE